MKRKTIRKIILLAVFAIIGIIATQLYWMNTAIRFQERENRRQEKQQALNEAEFNDRVKVALTNVAEQILTINNDPAELYKAVEQLRPNYFVVRINDTLHPYLLEQLLKREFDRNNVSEDYRYGIYDCFTDSIVYSDIVLNQEADPYGEEDLKEIPQIKWNTDAHYFSVTFPGKENLAAETFGSETNAFFLIALATILSLSFIAYALWVILKQKRLSEVKTDFINNMTHELKTPISTISLSSEVLLRKDIASDPERIQRYARIIHEENARLQNQVERVLQLAKLDKGEIDLSLDEIDIHEVIKKCVASFMLILEHTGGTIETTLYAEKAIVMADPVHVSNIINNLLDNAMKYVTKTPEIQIRTSNKQNGIEISIRDNGIGIEKESQKMIFTKFYRVPTGNLHDVKGFGLGLYYVSELVSRHLGRIRVNSEPDRGSEFIIWLPLKN